MPLNRKNDLLPTSLSFFLLAIVGISLPDIPIRFRSGDFLHYVTIEIRLWAVLRTQQKRNRIWRSVLRLHLV